VRSAAPFEAVRIAISKTQESSMYAVVSTGGKQYRVEAGTELVVERVPGDAGSAITFDRVLLVGDGEAVTVGTPTVEGATVSGTVLGEALGPKLIVFKFKQKIHYRRKNGHRQHLTRVRIDEISPDGKRAARSTAKAEEQKADEPKADAAAATVETEKKPARRTRTNAAAQAKPNDEAKAAADDAKPKTTRRRTPAKKAEPAAEAEE
jgi:large subunit ribosomal protein L21